jgi:hypothetical protein
MLLAGIAPSRAPAQSPDEIKRAVATMRQAGDEFMALITDLSGEQWTFHSAQSRRTIGEEAEHIALSEYELVQNVILERAVKRPKQPELAKNLAGKEQKIKERMLDPKGAVERYEPKARLKTKAEVLEFFERAHRQNLKSLQATPELGLHVARHPHPDYADMTALQWFYYVAYHNTRHGNQIKAIMADPAFPGGPRQAR